MLMYFDTLLSMPLYIQLNKSKAQNCVYLHHFSNIICSISACVLELSRPQQ